MLKAANRGKYERYQIELSGGQIHSIKLNGQQITKFSSAAIN